MQKVDEYTYLGVIFSKNGKFYKARKHVSDQANKALFSILQKGNTLNLPVDLQFKLFDEVVAPILLYGSEVWGYEDLKLIEVIHLKFCKYLLKLRKSTPSCMVYGETGRFPIELQIKSRMINFWARLLTDTSDKISSTLYKVMLDLHLKNMLHSPWIVHVEKILNESGMSNLWITQSIPNTKWLKHAIKLRCQDQYKQKWFATLQTSQSCTIYRIFKTEHKYEEYLNSETVRYILCKFRTTNCKLPINKFPNVDVNDDKTCKKCNRMEQGDEFHFLFRCPFLKDLRKRYIPSRFLNNPNTIQFERLMTCKKSMHKLTKFVLLGLKLYNKD